MKSNGCINNNTYLLIAMSILLLSYSLRVIGLTSESLWIDEGYSLALATCNIKEIVRGTAADQHPPLYYLLLHLWLLGGQSVFFLRYFSVLIGVVGVASTILLGQSLLGPKIGLLTGFLLACSPMHIWYSQEARMYILLSLQTTLSVYGFWRLISNSDRASFYIYFLSTLGALYTHYFAVFIVIVENLISLGWMLRKKGKIFKKWVGIQGVIVAAFIPWLPIALYQALYHRMRWISPPTAETVLNTLLLMVFGDSHKQVPYLISLVGGALFTTGVCWGIWQALKDKTQFFQLIFIGLWFFCPLLIIIIISLRYPVFQYKQMLIFVPPILMLIASGLAKLPTAQRWITMGVMGVFVINSLVNLYTLNTKHGWREAAIYIEANYRPGDLVYLNPAAGALVIKVYTKRWLPIDGYPPGYDVVKGGWEGNLVTAEIADGIMRSYSNRYNRIWLIEFTPYFWDPNSFFTTWLESHGQLIADQQFRGIRVRLYELDKATIP